MSPDVWGPPTWILFHTLAEKIHEDTFPILGSQLFFHIKKICANLPCPECSQHASAFLAKINFNGIKSKSEFKEMICFFHNTVNFRKKKPIFNPIGLDKYKKVNTITAYNNFVAVYHTRGNMKLLADSFQRKIVLVDFKKWLMNNIQSFL